MHYSGNWMFKKIHVFRVMPDKEIVSEINRYCAENKIKSGVVLNIIGSLKSLKLGFLKKLPANYITKEFRGPLEIVSGQGSIAMLDKDVVLHIHLTASNEDKTISGHLSEGMIFSTAEVVIGELKYPLKRKKDDYTGLNELI